MRTLHTGERGAVDSKSGEPVHQSGPGLRRPTPAATAGRKPEARPSPSQPKTGQGAGQSPATEPQREALCSFSPTGAREAGEVIPPELNLDEFPIGQLIEFFQMLDRWDREGAHGTQTM